MVTQVKSMGLMGIEGFLVSVEADLSKGIPCFDIVGLPDLAVKESKERVRSALRNCSLDFPIKRITVNLSPGSIKKEGPIYDLPILIALLCASEQLDPKTIEGCAFIGELSLDGRLIFVSGALPMALTAMQEGIKELFLPAENAMEGAAVEGLTVYPVSNVSELYMHLTGKKRIKPLSFIPSVKSTFEPLGDFSEVKGQQTAKRALEIAASGFHNVLMIGSPGAGKSMLAKRLPTILPPMSFEESLECTKIHSVAGLLCSRSPLITTRPFRAPHHTISAIGLSGGGRIPKPGEISLCHHGVLFLDELPEFSKPSLEVLRQPLEDCTVTITRVGGTITYPADFMLICAMNPCKCGFYSHPTRDCTCSSKDINNYLSRISGPLLDRIDMHIDVAPVQFDDLSSNEQDEKSIDVLKRVERAREIQKIRYEKENVLYNSRLSPSQTKKFCPLGIEEKQVFKNAFERLGLSARAYDRLLKVSRTIADLDESEDIKKQHILEAIQYRTLDRKYWRR